MRIGEYETHPAADLFPLLDGAGLRALADDIRAHGLLNPVVLLSDGARRIVLDGRNRLRACEIAGVPPRTVIWTGEGSPVEWVVSQNLHRRHLDASQRAMVAAGLVPMFAAEARERQRANLKQGGEIPVPAKLPERERGEAREKAAAAVNVSPRLVADAVKVAREATPETVEAVRQGKTTVSAAARDVRAEPRHARPAPPRAEKKDWNCTISLVVPHSALRRVVSALQRIGFEGGGGTSRKMRLKKTSNLHAA